MSVVHKKLHGDGEGPADEWYLKIPDGNIYGPVQLSVLTDWVAQLRVVPGNLVSTDKKNWVTAEDVPDLKMEWMAKIPSGEICGPFNVLAVPLLHDNGTLPADTVLTNRNTNKTVQLHEILSGSVTDGEKTGLRQKKEEKWEGLYKEEKAARRKAEAQQLAEMESLRKEMSAVQDDLKKVRQESTKRIVEQSKSDQAKLHDVETNEQKLLADLNDLQKKSKSDKKKLSELQNKLTDAESDLAEISVLRKKLERAEQTERELNEYKKEIGVIREESASLKEWKARCEAAELAHNNIQSIVKDLNSRLHERDTRVSEVENELIEQETRYCNLQNDYRKVESVVEEIRSTAESAESLVETVRREFDAKKASLSSEISRFDSEVRKLRDELSSSRKHELILAEENSRLADSIKRMISESEDKVADSEFKMQNMQKELETQKALYVKIESSLADKESVRQKTMEEAVSAKADALNRLSAYEKEHETFAKKAETEKQELRDRLSELIAKMEELSGRESIAISSKETIARNMDDERKEFELRLADMDAKMKSSMVENESLRKEIVEITNARDKVYQKLESESNRIAEIESSVKKRESSLLDEIKQIKQESSSVKSQLKNALRDMKERDEELEGVQLHIQAERDRLIQESQAAVQKVVVEEQEMESVTHGLREEISILKDQIKGLQQEIAERARLSSEESRRLEEERANFTELIDRSRSDVEVEKQKYLALYEEHKSLSAENTARTEGLAKQLKEMTDKADKHSEDIKNLRKEKDQDRKQLELRMEENATLKMDAEEQKKNMNQLLESVRTEQLQKQKQYEAELKKERDLGVELFAKVKELSCKLIEEENLLANTGEKVSTSQALRDDMESRYKRMLDENAEALEKQKQVMANIDSSLKAALKERDSIRSELTKLQTESSRKEDRLTAELTALKAERENEKQLRAEEKIKLSKNITDLNEKIEGLEINHNKAVKDYKVIIESLKTQVINGEKSALTLEAKFNRKIEAERKRAAEFEAKYTSIENTYKDLEARNRADAKEYNIKIKRLEDASGASAKVVENLNGEVLKYRNEYRNYQEKIEKLLREVEDKKVEISGLRGKYEPLLKNAQKNERDLLNKVSTLEKDKVRLQASVHSGKGDDDSRSLVRSIAVAVEVFLEQFPFVARTSFSVGIAVLAGFIVYFATRTWNDGNTGAVELVEPSVIQQTDSQNNVVAVGETIEPDKPEVKPLTDEPGVSKASEHVPADTKDVANNMVIDEDLDLPPAAGEGATDEEVVVKPKFKWPIINAKGVRVDYRENICRIIFEEGVFEYMTIIPERSLRVLEEVASDIRGKESGFKMIVEGHTDSLPMSDKASVQSNHELGMARAEAVISVMSEKFMLPMDFMIATSVGEKAPPYSNSNPDERKRNRTVVLELISN